MKNNLILGVQGFRKMLKSMFFVVILCTVSVGQARVVSGAQVADQQPTAPTVAAEVQVSPRRMQPVKVQQPVSVVSQEPQITTAPTPSAPLTSPRGTVRSIYPALEPAVSQQTEPQEQSKFIQGGVQPRMAPQATDQIQDGGWFSTLFDSQSYLAQLLSKTGLSKEGKVALTTTVGTAAAIFLGLAGYTGLMAALSLAGGAVALEKIGYLYRNGTITETAAVERVKDIMEQKINDTGMYPTYAMQIEALTNNRDFVNNRQVDDRVFNLARQQLVEQVRKNSAIALTDPKESLNQDNINNAIMELRKNHGSVNMNQFVKNLEGTADADKYRAYVSEYLRAKRIVAITAEKVLQARKEAALQQAEQLKKTQQPEGQPQPQQQKSSWRDYLPKQMGG